jgi:hypothetical protein
MKRSKTDYYYHRIELEIIRGREQIKLNKKRVLFLTKFTKMLRRNISDKKKVAQTTRLLGEGLNILERDLKISEVKIRKLSKYVPGWRAK